MNKLAVAALAAVTALSVVFSPSATAQGSDQFVVLKTTKGPIVLRIFYSMVPYTANNFLDLVGRGFYDGLSFHRVENWVVQGGDPNGNGSGNFVDPDTGRPRFLKLQADRRLTHNQPGMVAMARSRDLNSASCQFYILKKPMPQLNGQYAVFGKVVRGMDSVYAMGIGDRIVSASILEAGGGGNSNSGGGGGYSGPSTTQAVPGVAEPPPKPIPPPPTGDSGF